MKFLFSCRNSLSNLMGKSPEHNNDPLAKIEFHKSLFFGSIATTSSDDLVDNMETDEYNNEDNDELSCCGESGRQYKLSNLSLPLADTIGEYVQELSQDKFYLNDLSFIFEMSRKQSVSPYAIILAMIYMKRLRDLNQAKFVSSIGKFQAPSNAFSTASMSNENSTSLSSMELCLISILLASKYLTDEGENEEIYNDEWARAADLTTADVNKLERILLNKLDWNLYVSRNEFIDFARELSIRITKKKIRLQSDMCTYGDLECLFGNFGLNDMFSLEKLNNHLLLLSKVLFVCSSTLVYILLSSLLVSSYLLHLRNQLLHKSDLLCQSFSENWQLSKYTRMNESMPSQFTATRTEHNDMMNERMNESTGNYRLLDQNDDNGKTLDNFLKSSVTTTRSTFANLRVFQHKRIENDKLHKVNMSFNDYCKRSKYIQHSSWLENQKNSVLNNFLTVLIK